MAAAVENVGGALVAARVVDGALDDLYVDSPPSDLTPQPEAMYWGRVDRAAPAIGAAFVALPDGQRGWLRGADRKAGEMVGVQVSRWAEAGKAAPLTDRPILKGALALLTPGAPGVNLARSIKGHETRERLTAVAGAALAGAGEDVGLVIRSAAGDADEAALTAEIAALRAAFDAVQEQPAGREPSLLRAAPDAEARARRDWADADWLDGPEPFERLGVWDAIEALRSPRVTLPGGGWMSVEATAALVAVDVNTGEDFSKTASQTANLAACAALPRALRLRGFGGLVYIDFAPLKKGARQGVDLALKRAFAVDPVETQVVGWTPAGAVELQRKRERRPTMALIRG